MPRGNDPDARREFLERHGTLNPDIPTTNAEELIKVHSASQSRAVQKASLLPIDNEATADLDLADLGEKAGGNVVAAAVRGNAIVAVIEDEYGRTFKTVVPANDRYVAPEETAEDLTLRDAAMADLSLQAEISRLREEHESELAKLRAEFSEKMASEVASLREELQSDVQGKAQERGKAAEESETESKTKRAAEPTKDKPSR